MLLLFTVSGMQEGRNVQTQSVCPCVEGSVHGPAAELTLLPEALQMRITGVKTTRTSTP